ncbi:MAG: phosphoribosylglycinamide formyltransferase [Bacteroidetes bacterium B1(2017)]|nr:MAG: phosphoribosylglycinamide formyltransferase [Bacteroidetes bacterium B1(2017)]
MKQRLVIFASGSGSNAVNVVNYFSNNPKVEIVAVFCNVESAGVIPKMKELDIPVVVFNKAQFKDENYFLDLLHQYQPSLIALLGFLWKVPSYLVRTYPNKILNLHPALLPKFGGKGMYGHFVHEAVKEAGEFETGITIHWVNEHYDEGKTIAQYRCEVLPNDNASDIAFKIHQLEQKFVPTTIEQVLNKEL